MGLLCVFLSSKSFLPITQKCPMTKRQYCPHQRAILASPISNKDAASEYIMSSHNVTIKRPTARWEKDLSSHVSKEDKQMVKSK